MGNLIVEALLQAGTVDELDDMVRTVNICYPVLRNQLEVMEGIRR